MITASKVVITVKGNTSHSMLEVHAALCECPVSMSVCANEQLVLLFFWVALQNTRQSCIIC